MQIYLTDEHSLAFYKQQASPEFWDSHWDVKGLQAIFRK